MAKASLADDFDDFFDSPSRSPDPIDLHELDTKVKQSVNESKNKTSIAKPSSSSSSSTSSLSRKQRDGDNDYNTSHVQEGHHHDRGHINSAVSESFESTDIDNRNQKQKKSRTISESSSDFDKHSDSESDTDSRRASPDVVKHSQSVSGRSRSSPNKSQSDLKVSSSDLTERHKSRKKINSWDLERSGSRSRSSRQSSNDSGKTSDLLIHGKAKISSLERDTRRYSNSSGHSSDSRATPDSWRNRKDRSSSSDSNRASPQARDKTKRRNSSSDSSQSDDSRRASHDVVKKKQRKDSNSSVASSASSTSSQTRNKVLGGDRIPNRTTHSHTSYSSDSSTLDSERNGRKESYSSVASSSSSTHTYSQKDDTPRTPIDKRETDHSQAWNTQSKLNKKCLRPKTAKQQTSPKHAFHRQEKKGHSSDSDITDVSPITSPRNGFSVKHGKDACDGGNLNKKKFQAMPLHTEDKYMFDGGDKKALDLNILMKAVTELEKQKRVESNTRRVMFEPVRARTHNKSNFTFSIDDTRKIDQENQRLLHQIVRQMHTTEKKHPKMSDVKIKQAVITTSAINRRRQQQKIESENLAFLKRLQKVQASKGLSRTEQLSAYNSTVLHGVPIAALHPAKASARKSGGSSSCAGGLSRTRSLTSLHSAATASSFSTSSRQSSRAGSRPSSAKRSVQDRPPWDDRW